MLGGDAGPAIANGDASRRSPSSRAPRRRSAAAGAASAALRKRFHTTWRSCAGSASTHSGSSATQRRPRARRAACRSRTRCSISASVAADVEPLRSRARAAARTRAARVMSALSRSTSRMHDRHQLLVLARAVGPASGEQLDRSRDRRQRIADLVRDARREPTDRGQPLGALHRRLHAAQLRQILEVDDAPDACARSSRRSGDSDTPSVRARRRRRLRHLAAPQRAVADRRCSAASPGMISSSGRPIASAGAAPEDLGGRRVEGQHAPVASDGDQARRQPAHRRPGAAPPDRAACAPCDAMCSPARRSSSPAASPARPSPRTATALTAERARSSAAQSAATEALDAVEPT